MLIWTNTRRQYTKAIELDPKNNDAYFDRARCYFCLGEYQKAIDDCSKAIELDPKYTYAYFLRGGIYSELNEYQKAIDDCSKARIPEGHR